jgi:hypothetical protein
MDRTDTPAQEAFNILNAMLGICLALSPRLIGFQDAPAIWHACVLGVAISLASTSALVMFFAWEEWLVLALGGWVIAAPWAVGFADDGAATRVHVIVGTAVIIIAAVELWLDRNRRVSEDAAYRRARIR